MKTAQFTVYIEQDENGMFIGGFKVMFTQCRQSRNSKK